MRGISLLAVVLFGSSAFAARTVSITVDGTLKLTNPSTTTVTYGYTCKDKTGAQLTTKAGETLAAGASIVLGTPSGSTGCETTQSLSGSSTYLSNGAVRCMHTSMGYVAHPSAGSWCSAGFHVCSISEIATVRTSNNLYGFVSVPSTWSYTHDGGGTWTNTTSAAKIAQLDSMGSSSYRCATGANGGGTAINACYALDYTDSMTSQPYNFSSVICCPDLIGMSLCSVTIENATPANGHLQSPQFKGGSPF